MSTRLRKLALVCLAAVAAMATTAHAATRHEQPVGSRAAPPEPSAAAALEAAASRVAFAAFLTPETVDTDTDRSLLFCLVNRGGDGELVRDGESDDHLTLTIPLGPTAADLEADGAGIGCTAPLDWDCTTDVLADSLTLTVGPLGPVVAVAAGDTSCFELTGAQVNGQQGALLLDGDLEKSLLHNASRGHLLTPSIAVRGVPRVDEVRVRVFAERTFRRLRRLVDRSDRSRPRTVFVDNHVRVASAKWVYVLDLAGRQVFRPKELYPFMVPSFAAEIDVPLERWKAQPVPATLLERALSLSAAAFGADYGRASGTEVLPARELITSRSADGRTTRNHAGRTFVSFRPPAYHERTVNAVRSGWQPDGAGGQQLVVEEVEVPELSAESNVAFAADDQVVRLESRYLNAAAAAAVDLFREAVLRGRIRFRSGDALEQIRIGSFFDPDEIKFELTAFSWEGRAFLTDEEPATNPYINDGLYAWCQPDDSHADMALWEGSEQDLHFAWRYWDESGRVGGARGNLDVDTGQWTRDHVFLLHHTSLDAYSYVGTTVPWCTGGPLPDICTTCDGVVLSFQQGTGLKLEPSFYDDLDKNHVAVLLSHGGPFGAGTYQLRRGRDLWFPLHEAGGDGLGHDSLRHLFLETCAGMNWLHDTPENLSFWMTAGVADGLRTVCGQDGEHTYWDKTGWLFFERYNTDDAIIDAWFLSRLEEYECNVPVVVGYGGSEAEAAATLFDGRFRTDAAGTGWAVAAEMVHAGPGC